MRIRIYLPGDNAPDLTLSGTWTPCAPGDSSGDDQDVGVVTLDRPHRLGGKFLGPGSTVSFCRHALIVDVDSWQILHVPWPMGANVMNGPWVSQWVNQEVINGR